MIDIQINDRYIRDALGRLERRLVDMRPIMRDIGELIVERTKQRFADSRAPDGQRWAPNAPATIASYLRKTGGNFRKKGGLTKKGAARAAAKKPLIGETKQLMGTLYYQAGVDSVTIGSPLAYAAIHQFGGKAGRGNRITIPARPFLPVTPDRQLYPAEVDVIRERLSHLIAGKMA